MKEWQDRLKSKRTVKTPLLLLFLVFLLLFSCGDAGLLLGTPEIRLLADYNGNTKEIKYNRTLNCGTVEAGSGPLEITFTVENSGVSPLTLPNGITLDGNNADLFSLSQELESASVSPGDQTQFRLRYDPSGNSATHTIAVSMECNVTYLTPPVFSFTVSCTYSDTTAPTVNLSTSVVSPTSENPIPLTVTFSEAVTGFELSDMTVTGGTPSNLQSSDNRVFDLVISPESDESTIMASVPSGKVEDDDGNPNSASNTLTITYDVAAEDAPQNVTVSTPTNNTQPTWTWESGGGTGSYRCKLDDSDLSTGATVTDNAFFTPPVPLAEGTHTLYVEESDGAGNWSPPGICSVTIDLTDPETPALTPLAPDPNNNDTPTLEWSSVGDADSYRLQVDNDSNFTSPEVNQAGIATPDYTIPTIPDGHYYWRVKSLDAAGNESDYSSPEDFTIDATAPTVTASMPKAELRCIAPGSVIEVSFSEAMDPASITGQTISVSGISGTVSYSGTTARFTPAEPLEGHTTYTATVSTGVADVAGNPLAGEYSWEFTTATSDISAGLSHTALLKNEGSIWAWGRNDSGQLGDNSTEDRLLPVATGAGSTWALVETGGYHTAGIKEDGTLWTWGRNLSGQLGDGSTSQAQEPQQVGSGSDWLAVSAGTNHTVALKTDGTLWAWGDNGNGQLGDTTTTNRNAPVQIGTDTDWLAVSAGDEHTVALKTDGTLWAWGYNGYGQLGDATDTKKTTPAQIGSGTDWAVLAAGGNHTAALKNDGSLWVWGDNQHGQYGDGSTTNENTPTQSGSDTDWTALAAGSYHTVALKSGGSLWAWGLNNQGQVGNGTTEGCLSPVQVGGENDWTAIAAGGAYTVGLKTDGTLRTWGDNSNGQLGDRTTVDKNKPVVTGSHSDWERLSARLTHTIAIKEDGTLWAWGLNDSGQLGSGNTTDAEEPQQIGTDSDWYRIGSGSSHSLAIKQYLHFERGTLWSWGDDGHGQLGNGAGTAESTPQQIGAAANWTAVAGGASHSLGLQSTGALWAWGYNGNGQLGLGDNADEAAPVQVGSDTDWEEIACGDQYSAAIKSDGTLWTWGQNSLGQLGLGDNTERTVPVQVGTDTDWSAVRCGYAHTVALKSDGTLWAWGHNGYGQLGDNSETNRNAPVQVGSDTDWAAIGIGQGHTLAVKSDGSLWTWGHNENGQLGLGDTEDRKTPVQVGSEIDWGSLPGGGDFSLALKTSGALWSWGKNDVGQLGEGTTTQREEPGPAPAGISR